MATQLDNRCPICLGSWEEASFVMPCLQRFCSLRWAETKPKCPATRQAPALCMSLCWQDIASSAKEVMGKRSSAARDGDARQPPQAGPAQAEADSQCPICLGDIKKAAYVAYCMHCFCFACIQRWARQSQVCPVCRQPLEQLLHSVRGDDDYEEYVVGLPARLRRRMATERARSRSPQRRYNLRSRPGPSTSSRGRERSPGGPR